MNILIILFIISFIISSFIFLDKFLIKRNIIVLPINPYNNKVSFKFYYNYFNINIFILGSFSMLIYFNFISFIISFIMLLFYCLFFYLNYRKNIYGEVLLILNDKVDEKNYLEIAEKNKKISSKKVFIEYEKLIFTDKYIFYTHKKKISLKKEGNQQLQLSSIELNKKFLKFNYTFIGSLSFLEYIFYIENTKDKNLLNVLKFYKEKIGE